MTDRQAGMEEVPPGYKRTEMGVVPEEWRHCRLGDCGEVIMGQSPPGASYNRTGIGSPLINGPTEFTDLHPIKIQWTTQPAKFCKPGDLLICVRGSSTGRINYANDTYAIGRGVAAIRAKGDNNTTYLSYQVISAVSDILAAATGSTFPSVDGKSLRSIGIPLPLASEQRAIAAALSDADGLIGALDALIEKKRAVKQAAMQQLLTGKKRLPGFSGECEMRYIGEFTDCTAGGTPSKLNPEYWGGQIRWMSSGELNHKIVLDVEGRITDKGLRNSSTKIIPPRCVLVGLAGQGKTRGTVAMNMVELCTNQSIAAIFPNDTFVPEYLYYNLDARYDELRGMSSGAGGRGGLNLRIIRSIAVPFPSVSEQHAIATVLSDMDAEIAALERRREKAEQIKQGMMQQLLTGKVRLVEPECEGSAALC